jgi:cytochrome c-type biogenesis protein CcmE
MKFIVGGMVVLSTLAWLGFVGFQESKAYYVTVEEFSGMKDRLHGKTLKVAGDVVEGSITRSTPHMEFTISSGPGKDLRVRYVGNEVIPDTFKDGSKAVVEGGMAPDGVFLARHIEAKCASKYEAEYDRMAGK